MSQFLKLTKKEQPNVPHSNQIVSSHANKLCCCTKI